MKMPQLEPPPLEAVLVEVEVEQRQRALPLIQLVEVEMPWLL
tara:strand:- start:310 stop:435 length:126 start_codon:yes stop_codon:yes gene_type:complete